MPNIFTEDVMKQADDKRGQEQKAAEAKKRAAEQAAREKEQAMYKFRGYTMQCLREFPAAAQARNLPVKKVEVQYDAPIFFNKYRIKFKMMKVYDIGYYTCISQDAETFITKYKSEVYAPIKLSVCAEKLIRMLAYDKGTADRYDMCSENGIPYKSAVDMYCERVSEDDIRNYFATLLTRQV